MTKDKTNTVTKHFVTFLSPGTFFNEETTKPISRWDIGKATKMAKTIKERYGAVPFAFVFSTRIRGPKDLDSHEIKHSGRYYLGGRLMTLSDVIKEVSDSEILQSNMRCNKWKYVIMNDNSYRTFQQFDKHKDTILTP